MSVVPPEKPTYSQQEVEDILQTAASSHATEPLATPEYTIQELHNMADEAGIPRHQVTKAARRHSRLQQTRALGAPGEEVRVLDASLKAAEIQAIIKEIWPEEPSMLHREGRQVSGVAEYGTSRLFIRWETNKRKTRILVRPHQPARLAWSLFWVAITATAYFAFESPLWLGMAGVALLIGVFAYLWKPVRNRPQDARELADRLVELAHRHLKVDDDLDHRDEEDDDD